MSGLLEVFRGVLILGGIAAPHVAASHAQAQMDPGVAHLYALLANMFLCAGYLYLIQMRASVSHSISFRPRLRRIGVGVPKPPGPISLG